MKFLTDFFPILLFYLVYQLYDIYAATATAIVASFIQVLVGWLRNHKIEKMHLVTFGIILVFGGLTLFLKNEMFIKWKPTVLYWLFGLAFIISHFIGEKNLVERMLSQAITVPLLIWQRVNFSWALFFLLLGGLNLFVVYHFNTDTWVNFKLFGTTGLMFLFIFAQVLYLSQHQPDDESDKQADDESQRLPNDESDKQADDVPKRLPNDESQQRSDNGHNT